MVELMSIDVGDGSSLVLGVLGERGQPETNVPHDAELVFQHKRPGVEEEIYPLTDGRFNSHFPVIVDGRSHVVFAGEVESCVDAVLLRFSEPDELPSHEYLAQVAEPLGRRIWMSHLQPFRLDTHVWVAWIHGQPEHIALATGATRYGSLPNNQS